jgi:nickel/cobalt exporter
MALKAALQLERVTGIEPASPAWKAGALPLSYTRLAVRIVHQEALGTARAWAKGQARTSLPGGNILARPSLALAVLLAAAVGSAHAASPDHWLPVAMVARVQGASPRRAVRLALLAALGHIGVSLAVTLGAASIAWVGWIFQTQGSRLLGAIFLGLAAWMAWREVLTSHGERPPTLKGEGAAVLFGVAASPNVAVVPLALVAHAHGPLAMALVLGAFSVATLASFVGLVLTGYRLGRALSAASLGKWANLWTAALFAAMGAWVLLQPAHGGGHSVLGTAARAREEAGCQSGNNLARLAGLEPATFRVEAGCSLH